MKSHAVVALTGILGKICYHRITVCDADTIFSET
jgi:hypothetical protein